MFDFSTVSKWIWIALIFIVFVAMSVGHAIHRMGRDLDEKDDE